MRMLKKIAKVFGVLMLLIMIGCSVMKNYNDHEALNANDDKAKKEFKEKGIVLKSNTILVDGKKLHYLQTGKDNATTLVFIHGSPGDWKAFRGFLSDSVLISKYRVISVDRPGFGGSDYGKAMPVMEQCRLINLMFKVINNGKKIIAIGHSLGGPVVAELAESKNQNLAGIVVLSGSVAAKYEEKENWRYLINTIFFRFLLPTDLSTSNNEILYFKKEVAQISDNIKEITVPICVIHGDKDPLVPVENAYFIQKENPTRTQLHIIKGANHFIPWTKESFIKNTIVEFVDKIVM